MAVEVGDFPPEKFDLDDEGDNEELWTHSVDRNGNKWKFSYTKSKLKQCDLNLKTASNQLPNDYDHK